jgi:hypothetical protein
VSRESQYYYDVLEDLLKFFGGRRHLTISDMMRYDQSERRAVMSRYGMGKEGANVAVIARKICGQTR